MKSRFLSMASHEFRNPLSSILVCADLLSSNPSNVSIEEQSFYIQTIKDSALNIQTILEDVLILSKAEAGKQAFKPERLELREICEQVIKEMELSYSGRTINLIVPDGYLEFYGDAKLLWHILTNLLSNALKYSPDRESVELEIVDRELAIVVEIRDKGIGIPPTARENLFDFFYRANNVGDVPGTGLGLAIVKQAIDLHNGTIEVISHRYRGTTVRLQLPKKVSA